MAYTKQNFENGQILTAEQLNHMEQGIAAPDWNNMTNRPFGDEFVALVPEAEFVGVDQNGVFVVNFDPFLFDGTETELAITFDGVKYTCTAFSNGDMTFFGNLALSGVGDDTGEPFCLVVVLYEAAMLGIIDGNPHTLSIERGVVKKLDPKYIKDMYGIEGEATFMGSLSFTATSANTMDYTFASTSEGADAELIGDLSGLSNKGEIVEVKINGAVGMMGVAQDRAYTVFSGALSGSLHWSNGSVWSATVNIPDVALTTGTTYTVNFYDTRKRKLKTIDPKYLPPVVLASPNGTKFNLTVSDDGTLGATPVS